MLATADMPTSRACCKALLPIGLSVAQDLLQRNVALQVRLTAVIYQSAVDKLAAPRAVKPQLFGPRR